jgi:hypothetical protein
MKKKIACIFTETIKLKPANVLLHSNAPNNAFRIYNLLSPDPPNKIVLILDFYTINNFIAQETHSKNSIRLSEALAREQNR